MKAVIAHRYGGPDVLMYGDAPKPKPKANEVLVRIEASAVTQADVMMRRGVPRFGRIFLGLRAPKAEIPGTAFAGTIEAIGADVTRFVPGQNVFGETTVGFSAHAQFVTVAENGILQAIPETMSYEQASPVTDGALTAFNFLKRVANVQPGQSVLINGASGGLGTAAVQLAKHFGAEVTAVASSRNAELAKELGADEFIDYTQEDFTREAARYDIIFDTVGKVGFRRARNALKPNGQYLSPVLELGILTWALWTSRVGDRKARFSATGLLPHDQLRDMLQEVTSLIARGVLTTIIDRRYPLEEIALAHAYVEGGHKRGNVVLDMGHKAPRLLSSSSSDIESIQPA